MRSIRSGGRAAHLLYGRRVIQPEDYGHYYDLRSTFAGTGLLLVWLEALGYRRARARFNGRLVSHDFEARRRLRARQERLATNQRNAHPAVAKYKGNHTLARAEDKA